MFKKYMHVERLGSSEVDGLLVGWVYVQPKIDGANAQLWWDGLSTVMIGSRNQEVDEKCDLMGFHQWVKDNEARLSAFFREHPTWRLYGEWLCLSGDTIVKKTSAGKNGKGNYMTIKEMYDYLHTDEIGRTCGWWKRYGMPSIYSLDESRGIVLPNRIRNIIHVGKKNTYKLRTRLGFEIKATAEHPFWTNSGWRQLADLDVGDVVGVCYLSHNAVPHRRLGEGARNIQRRMELFKKNNAKCVQCGSIDDLQLDHIDEDYRNNDECNWQVLCKKCHDRKSAQNKKTVPHSKGYQYYFDTVISIKRVGEEDVYDIQMNGDSTQSNFVANGFIVHNCPHSLKTYRDDAWRNFYVFDVFDDETDQFVPIVEYMDKLKAYDIEFVPLLAIVDNPTEEYLRGYLERNTYLIKDGAGVGEGIVIKRYDFRNKYGRTTWGKLVRNEFKEKNAQEFGVPNVKLKQSDEAQFAAQYVTRGRIDKELAKIGDWNSRMIPQLFGIVYHDLVTEELWDYLKSKKNKVTIDFNSLYQHVIARIKSECPELF